MTSEIAQYNLDKDKKVLGKDWLLTYGSYFADEGNINLFIEAVKPCLPNGDISILYAASASGLLGEKLIENLGRGQLTIVDISQKHLNENKNPNTTKVCLDLLEMNLEKQFDVIIMRSSLDYFPTKELQIEVLKIIRKHLKPAGIFINQPAFISNITERDLISEAYNRVNKIGNRLFQSDDLADLYLAAGFSVPEKIGEGKIMCLTEKDHVTRYDINQEEIRLIQDGLRPAKDDARVTDLGYEMDFHFPIFLAKVV